MSLKDAILSIAEEMLLEAEDLKGKPEDEASSYLHDSLKGWARQLKVACKAAGDPAAQVIQPQSLSALASPNFQHILEIEKAKEEFRRAKQHEKIEERHLGGGMVEVVGGPAAPHGADGKEVPTFQSVESEMPVGAFTELAGGIYQLQNHGGVQRLVFNEAQTERLKLSRVKRGD